MNRWTKKNLINLFHRTITNATKSETNQKKYGKKTKFSILPIRNFKVLSGQSCEIYLDWFKWTSWSRCLAFWLRALFGLFLKDHLNSVVKPIVSSIRQTFKLGEAIILKSAERAWLEVEWHINNFPHNAWIIHVVLIS